MNRSLLIIVCDFLLLSLLALARFDVADTDVAEGPGEDEMVVAENIRADRDMLEMLQLSLEDERAAREALTGDLEATQRELEEREQAIAEREERLGEMELTLEEREREQRELEEERRALEEARAALETDVTQAREELAEVTEEAERRSEDFRRERERALEMEQELRERMEELEETRTHLAELEEQHREAEEAYRRMETQLELSESEKRLIRENLEQAREEVAIVRQERERVEEQARELATGVTQLAERSDELGEEIRRSQPKTSGTIFNEFLENRLDASFFASRGSLLGPVHRSESPRTILISFGDERIFALFHVRETGLNLNDSANWERFQGRIRKGSTTMQIDEVGFLSVDPRVVLVPLEPATAEELNAKVYPVTREPFQFPEAVLISSDGDYYGESPFELNAENPRYVRMRSRTFTRLVGDFSPSAGDIVFSKAGEVIGIMVNNEYCVLVDNHLPAARLQLGDNITGERTADLFSRLRERLQPLPRAIRN